MGNMGSSTHNLYKIVFTHRRLLLFKFPRRRSGGDEITAFIVFIIRPRFGRSLVYPARARTPARPRRLHDTFARCLAAAARNCVKARRYPRNERALGSQFAALGFLTPPKLAALRTFFYN